MKNEAIARLQQPPSSEQMLRWMGWLDSQPFGDDDEDKLPYQMISRSILAGGYLILSNYDGLTTKARANVENTIDALERYVLAPSVALYEAYWVAATISYPFGAGDGCLSVPALAVDNCEAGSGCSSGAGSIYQIGLLVGEVAVMEAISAELLPWLQNDHDPVEQRILNS